MSIIRDLLEVLTDEIRFELFGTGLDIAYWQVGVIMGLFTFILAVLLNARTPRIGGRGISFVHVVITGPIVEELIFRLTLISVFSIVFGSTIIGIVLSAFLFALGHTIYGQLRFVDSFVQGLLFGWAFVTIGIGVTIIAHMTHNLFAFFTGG